jgi:hypothetical protein
MKRAQYSSQLLRCILSSWFMNTIFWEMGAFIVIASPYISDARVRY